VLARTQFQAAYERSPLRGPGQLQDLQGPSYLFAILTDPRVAEASTDFIAPVPAQVRAPSRPAVQPETPSRPRRASVSVSLAVPAGWAIGTLSRGHRVGELGVPSGAIREGWIVQHWVKPFAGPSLGADPKQSLLTAEAELIQRWDLRRAGWNRG
jgi:hypothetical protein